MTTTLFQTKALNSEGYNDVNKVKRGTLLKSELLHLILLKYNVL